MGRKTVPYCFFPGRAHLRCSPYAPYAPRLTLALQPALVLDALQSPSFQLLATRAPLPTEYHAAGPLTRMTHPHGPHPARTLTQSPQYGSRSLQALPLVPCAFASFSHCSCPDPKPPLPTTLTASCSCSLRLHPFKRCPWPPAPPPPPAPGSCLQSAGAAPCRRRGRSGTCVGVGKIAGVWAYQGDLG